MISIYPRSPSSRSTHLNNLIIVHAEEERYTIPLLPRAVHYPVHGALVHTIRPTHQEVSNIDNETPFDSWSRHPSILWTQNLQTRSGRAEQDGEALIVAVGAEADLVVFPVLVQRLWVFGWWVIQESCYACDIKVSITLDSSPKVVLPPGCVIISSK